jgi:hypothetical protein
MKWRVMLELIGPNGTVVIHEVGGHAAVAEYAPRMIGLTLEEGKHLLAALQVHLIQAQAEDHISHAVIGNRIPFRVPWAEPYVSNLSSSAVRSPA